MQLVLLCSVAILSGVTSLSILNTKCKNGTEPWTCKPTSKCLGWKNALENEELDFCGFEGGESVVCCPPEPQQPEIIEKLLSLYTLPGGGKKAEEKCREYSKYVYREIISPSLKIGSYTKRNISDCAINAETLIVGGDPAKSKEFPHMALIGIEFKKGSPSWFCGGSLISPNYVLTAAHCETKKYHSNASTPVVVRLGELDLLDDNDQSTIDVKIAQVIDHPMYVPTKAYHDITLLKLEKEVELGPNIRPLCLHTKRSFKHKKAIATGWGLTSYGNNDSVSSNILLKVQLDLTDDDKCVSAYGKQFLKVSEGIYPVIMMCSGGVRGKDSCKGDSGGPLQVATKDPYCMYSQIGITSLGLGCGSTTPGVYTRVSTYVPWIENIVWP